MDTSCLLFLLTFVLRKQGFCYFSHIFQCRLIESPSANRIVTTLVIKGKESFYGSFNVYLNVFVDTASSVSWFIKKDYSLWHFETAETINKDTEFVYDFHTCDLIAPAHQEIPENQFTVSSPKYEPDQSRDITVYPADMTKSCTNHILYADFTLLVIYNVYEETVVIGNNEFNISIAGVNKIVRYQKYDTPEFMDGLLGLMPDFDQKTNKPNFLYFLNDKLTNPMYSLYVGTTDTSCQLGLGKPLEGIKREKLITLNATAINESWAFWSIRVTMRFCDGTEHKEQSLSDESLPIMIDSGTPGILLLEAMNAAFYQNLEISTSCDYWVTKNAEISIFVEDMSSNSRILKLNFDTIIQRDPRYQTVVCNCLIDSHKHNYIILGASIFKRFYVEFHFDVESRQMKIGSNDDIFTQK